MVYEDYRKAALKHLKTCEFMIENIHRVPQSDILHNQVSIAEWENNIIRNIFYLCGYVIEATVNYSIYKINYGISRLSDDVIDLNEYAGWTIPHGRFRRRCGICFRLPDTQYMLLNCRYEYFIGSHDYGKNIEYLRLKRNSPRLQALFPQRGNVNGNKNAQLFYLWKVNQRYQTDATNSQPTTITNSISITPSEITEYFFFTERIYSELPSLI